MSDDDLIRRGDALLAIAGWEIPSTAIAALPAVTPRVKPLVWEKEEDGSRWYAECPIDPGEHYLADTLVEILEVEKSRAARILAALDMQPAQDAPAEDATAKGETCGQMLDRLGMDGAKWAAEFRTTAIRLGYADMDEGWLVGWFCNAIMAGYDRKPSPDAQAIREAALREAHQRVNDLVSEREADLHGARNDFNRGAVDALQEACSAILALIGTTAEGGA